MEDEIKCWLDKSGYPLELYLSSELSKRKYIGGKSEIYIDLETGKKREIDVTGYHHGETNNKSYSCARRLIFECKKSTKPLLNLCVNKEQHSRFYHQAFNGDPEDIEKPDFMAYFMLEESECTDEKSLIGRFAESTPLGYSLVPAFGKSDQDIYSGLMGLIKASAYNRRLFSDFKNEVSEDLGLHFQDRNIFEFHLAALVVDAPLFDVYLNEDGSINVSESDWSMIQTQLPWNFNPHDSSEGYCIHIVTKKAFPEFLDSVEKLHGYIYLPEHLEHMLDKRPQHKKISARGLLHKLRSYVSK